jgi:mRNA interferase RelE/StbE
VFKIIYSSQAVKTLLKIPRNKAKIIREKINVLATDPYNTFLDAKKLQGRSGYRLRVGDWRIIYEIKNDELIIIIMKIASRGDVYK